jgi:hypothetical protein
MHAGIAAERPPRRGNRTAAPSADRRAGVIALGLAPLIRGDDTLAPGAHGRIIGASGLRPQPLPRALGLVIAALNRLGARRIAARAAALAYEG